MQALREVSTKCNNYRFYDANPFDTEQNSLVSLASGFVIDDNVADSLLEAERNGENQFLDFVHNNLINEKPDIFQPIKKNPASNYLEY